MRLADQIFAAAQAYHDLGISIVPFKVYKTENGEYEKKNLDAWKEWMERPQTEQEFKALNWSEANAFGIILGTEAKNGRYLSAVDYDVKGEVSEEVKLKGKEILKDFPITQKEQTANKGLHLVYWSRNKVRTDGVFHDTTGLELLGEKKLCLMSPSFGYSNLNDNGPTEIENLEETFYEILKRNGFRHTEETEVENQLDNFSFSIDKIVDLSKLTKNGYEYQGSHPIHDSTTEKNFCVNTKTNTWFCFRHNSGGGALQFLAVKEGIIKCEQAKKGALRGKKFRQVLQIASSQGLIDQKVLEQSEINPVILAKDLMEDYVFVVDEDTNELYYYNETDKFYKNNTEQLTKREIVARLDENFKARYYNEISEFITGKAPLVKMNLDNPEMLPVKNGIVNLDTKELIEHSPKFYITSKLDVVYDPAVKYEESYNAQFLKEVVASPIQRKQMKQLVGHCLHRKILTETALVLLGKGGNGKSIFLDTTTAFLGGSRNVSSKTIQTLCYDKFALIEIKNKLANISADLPHKELMNTGNFRALVSGDSVDVNRKHVQGKGESIKPFTKYIYSANHLPPIANEEDCYAWYRRFIFADFKKTFTPENSIPRQDLLARLSTEKEFTALLNWAIEGYTELKENGDVTNKPSVEDIRKEYRKRASTTLAYFDDKVTITDSQDDEAFTDDWFRDYVTYCHNEQITPKSKGQFVNDVQQFLPGAQKARIRPSLKANPVSAWRYVKYVSSVPAVSVSGNMRAKTEKNDKQKKLVSNEKVGKVDTSGTGDTEQKKIHGQCANFRTPLCRMDNWETLNGNADARGEWCFKPKQEDFSYD